MSLKDVIFKMSRYLIETCESSEDLRLKQTAFPRKRRLGAQNLLRILMGATKFEDAAAGTIRGDFAHSTTENLIHGSDSLENAEIEIARFFN